MKVWEEKSQFCESKLCFFLYLVLSITSGMSFTTLTCRWRMLTGVDCRKKCWRCGSAPIGWWYCVLANLSGTRLSERTNHLTRMFWSLKVTVSGLVVKMSAVTPPVHDHYAFHRREFEEPPLGSQSRCSSNPQPVLSARQTAANHQRYRVKYMSKLAVAAYCQLFHANLVVLTLDPHSLRVKGDAAGFILRPCACERAWLCWLKSLYWHFTVTSVTCALCQTPFKHLLITVSVYSL